MRRIGRRLEHLRMRLMAYGRWVGVRCDHCARRAASRHGLRAVLGAECWFHHGRVVNRHPCAACLEALPIVQWAEYVGANGGEVRERRLRDRAELPAAR